MLPLSYLSLLSAVAVFAAPSPASVKSDLPKFIAPKNVAFSQVNSPPPEYFGPLNFAAKVSIAKKYIAEKVGGDFDITSSHESDHNGLTYVYLRQHHNGLPIANLVANVAVDGKGSVFTASHLKDSPNFPETAADVPTVAKTDAVIAAAKLLGYNTENLKSLIKIIDNKATGLPFALSPVPVELNYFYNEKANLELVYTLSIQEKKRWNRFFVSATTGQVISSSNWVNDFGGSTSTSEPPSQPTDEPTDPSTPAVPKGTFQYRAIPFNKDNVQEDGTQLIVNPADKVASPKGWHNAPGSDGQVDSQGNNVAASVDGWSSKKYAKSKNGGSFDYKYDLKKDPGASQDAAITNVFHLANRYHDVLYHYGFTEAAGNFQNDNYGKGGQGNDAILASVQNSEGTDNANFATPPDGQPGIMNMYIFDVTTPNRDGDMENAVVVHEMTHGLSNRLTGGSAQGDCLETDEAGGMGEGWSDTIAWAVSMHENDTRKTDRATGQYVMNNPIGIRQYPYSTNLKTNPHTYSNLQTSTEVHDVGEVWSTMLYDVYWNVVEMSGFSAEILTDAKTSGNQRFIQLVVDGLKLQPCNPTFVQARDAILAADKADYGSKYFCAIWKAFAKRGLGVSADSSYADAFDLPKGC